MDEGRGDLNLLLIAEADRFEGVGGFAFEVELLE